MGIIREVSKNIKGEVTGVTLFKGGTREIVKHHISQLILLLSPSKETDEIENPSADSELEENLYPDNSVQIDPIPKEQSYNSGFGQGSKRNAALKGRDNIKKFLGIK
ncbi:UNVERIFIED_CONTAM: hypothetical protein RMT77_006913 [Armadillidium vulgare]